MGHPREREDLAIGERLTFDLSRQVQGFNYHAILKI